MSVTQPTRGRPSAERAAEIDRALLAAALDLFVETGYEATTMEAIAARAQVSKGTLYARYSGKEALFRAMLDGQMQGWSKRAGEADHLLPMEVEGRMRHHARTLAYVFHWPEFQRVSQLLDTVSATFPDLVREWHQIGSVHYLDFLANDIAKAAEAEGRPPEDWRLIANILLHAITSWHRSETMLGRVNVEEAMAYADKVAAFLFSRVER